MFFYFLLLFGSWGSLVRMEKEFKTLKEFNLENLEWIEAECTCECGCKNPTQVLTECQRLNNQCWECQYSHR